MEQKQINDRIDDIVDNAGDGLCCSHAACHKMRDTSPFSILRPRNFSFGKESDPSPRCNAHSERERRPQCPGEQTSRAHLLCFLFLELTPMCRTSTTIYTALVSVAWFASPARHPTHADVQLFACFCGAFIPLSSVVEFCCRAGVAAQRHQDQPLPCQVT